MALVLLSSLARLFQVHAWAAQKEYPGGNAGTITAIDYGECGMNTDAVLVKSDGKYILMDTGYTDNEEDIANSSVIKFLKSKGVNELDLYLSHWHNDHYYLMSTIIKDPYFTIGTVYLPNADRLLELSSSENSGPGWYRDLTKNLNINGESWGPHSYTEIQATLAEAGIKPVILSKGDSFTVGSALFEVLWQQEPENIPSDSVHDANQLINNTSLVTRVTIGGIRYLTAGDIHKSVEREMMSAGVDVKADIFKTSHHSNRSTSNCPEFLKEVGASWAFGTGEATEKCREAVSGAGTNYINVKNNGQIKIEILNGEISVSAEKDLQTLTRIYVDSEGLEHTKEFCFAAGQDVFFTDRMIPQGCSYVGWARGTGIFQKLEWFVYNNLQNRSGLFITTCGTQE